MNLRMDIKVQVVADQIRSNEDGIMRGCLSVASFDPPKLSLADGREFVEA